jgi:hypothetical protein
MAMLVACGGNETGAALRNTPWPAGNSSSSCQVNEYKTEATAQMIRLQAVMIGIDLKNMTAVAQEKRAIKEILSDINSMKCRNAYPLKQETLEDTARHFITALDSLEGGNLSAFQSAMNGMELKASAFYDWSIDMD